MKSTKELLERDIKRVGWRNSEIKEFTIRDIKANTVSLTMAECQREFCTKHGSKFIFALLYGNLGLLSASFCKRSGRLIDGQQRVTSIINFTNDEFALNLKGIDWVDDEIKSRIDGYHFSDLPKDVQDMILDRTVYVNCYANLTPTSESSLYVLMNSSATALSAIEIIKARFSKEFWDIIQMLKNHPLFAHMSAAGRFIKEKNILEMMCICLGYTNKTKFTDNIEEMRVALDTDDTETRDRFIATFMKSMQMFNSIYVDDNNIFKNKKLDSKTSRPTYHFYDEKVMYYLFTDSCIKVDESVNMKKATALRDAACRVYSALLKNNYYENHSYEYFSTQGNDTVKSMKNAATIVVGVKEADYE